MSSKHAHAAEAAVPSVEAVAKDVQVAEAIIVVHSVIMRGDATCIAPTTGPGTNYDEILQFCY